MMPETSHPDHIAPQKQPIKPRAMVHDDQTWPIERLLVTADLHSHPKYKLCKRNDMVNYTYFIKVCWI